VKRLFIVATIIVAVVLIAIFQQSRLHNLQEEIASFENEKKPTITTHRSPRKTTRLKTDSSSTKDLAYLEKSFIEMLLITQSENQNRTILNRNHINKLALIASKLSPDELAALIENLQNVPALTQIDSNKIVESFLEFCVQFCPSTSLTYLQNYPESKISEQLLSSAFYHFSLENPQGAISWFEEQVLLGDLDVESFHTNILLVESTLDADSMLARALSPEFSENPDHLKHLGSQRMLQWPQKEVERIIDSEFTSAEKFAFAAHSSRYGAISDYEQKGDWYLEIDQDAWNKWAAKSNEANKHPAISHIATWARHSNKIAAAEWLQKQKPSPLKEKMTLEYAWAIAKNDPAGAAIYLSEIPEGKNKARLEKRINKAKGN